MLSPVQFGPVITTARTNGALGLAKAFSAENDLEDGWATVGPLLNELCDWSTRLSLLWRERSVLRPEEEEVYKRTVCFVRQVPVSSFRVIRCQGPEIDTCRAKWCSPSGEKKPWKKFYSLLSPLPSLYLPDHLSLRPCCLQVQRGGVSEAPGLHGPI